MLGYPSLRFIVLWVPAIISIACRPALHARRHGVLAATVDSALQASPRLVCNAIPLALQTGQLEPATGCYFPTHDTLFYFYVAEEGEVLAWGQNWHVPDSSRAEALEAVARANAGRYGPGTPCTWPRVDGFTVWRAASHFVFAYTDPDAAKLSLPENFYEGARVGSPTCTFRDQ